MPVEYQHLDLDELILIARDRLRDLESDHFRLEITQEEADAGRKLKLESKIANAQATLEELQSQQAAQAKQIKKAGPIKSGPAKDTRQEVTGG